MEALWIFPEGGLEASIITTVFVGVFVSVFFNLRLGWPLAGLVIPGYLAPLILAQPRMAAFTIAEGTVGYLAFLTLTTLAYRLGVWPHLFGRDRFFAIILMSIVTRICTDGFILSETYSFHSIGFILVALMINYYWTAGFFSGLFMMAITTSITALITRYGLMEFTNFRLSQINYAYLDSWSDFLESPKIYMVLAATAFIASRINFFYGLDFGGIIIPALLALQWYDPLRILITLVEAWMIYLVGSGLVHSFFSGESLLGGRKIAFFFSIGFFYKLAFGFILFHFLPSTRTIDYYGFGYLLSTFIAIRVYDMRSGFRTSRALLQTSFYGLVIGLLSSTFLDLPSQKSSFRQTPSIETQKMRPLKIKSPEITQGYLSDIFSQIQSEDLNQATLMLETLEDLTFWDQEILSPLMRLAKRSLSSESYDLLARINGAADLFGYDVRVLKDPGGPYLVLGRYALDKPYRGTYVFAPGKRAPFVITIPRAGSEAYTLERGLDLLEELHAAALFIGETPTHFTSKGYVSAKALTKREQNILTLAREAYVRALGDTPFMFVEVRGLANPNFLDPKKGPGAALTPPLLALSEGILTADKLSPLAKELWKILLSEDPKFEIAGGSPKSAGYESASSKISDLLKRARNKELAIVWYPLDSRTERSWPGNNIPLRSHLNGLQIRTEEGVLKDYLSERGIHPISVIPPNVITLMDTYQKSHNVFYLVKTFDALKPFRPVFFMDKPSRRGIFLIENKKRQVCMILNPQGADSQTFTLKKDDLERQNFRRIRNKIIEMN